MHDKVKPAPEQDAGDHLFGESPAELLIVGALPESLLKRTASGVAIRRFATLADAESYLKGAAVPRDQADEIARILVLEPDPSDDQFEQQLGRAVRACPYHVLLHCTSTDAQPGRADKDYFAFGFRKLSVLQDCADERDTRVKWFEYRLSQYKPAPDWLNARFWANPERFDVDDDPDGYYEVADDYDDD